MTMTMRSIFNPFKCVVFSWRIHGWYFYILPASFSELRTPVSSTILPPTHHHPPKTILSSPEQKHKHNNNNIIINVVLVPHRPLPFPLDWRIPWQDEFRPQYIWGSMAQSNYTLDHVSRPSLFNLAKDEEGYKPRQRRQRRDTRVLFPLAATTETLSGTHQQQQHAVNSSPVYSVIISCWSPTHHHHQHRTTGPCLSACLILLSSSFVVVPKTNSSLVLSALVDELPQQQQLSMLNKGEYGDGTDRRLTWASPTSSGGAVRSLWSVKALHMYHGGCYYHHRHPHSPSSS